MPTNCGLGRRSSNSQSIARSASEKMRLVGPVTFLTMVKMCNTRQIGAGGDKARDNSVAGIIFMLDQDTIAHRSLSLSAWPWAAARNACNNVGED